MQSDPPAISLANWRGGYGGCRTNVIGMIIPDITNPFFPAVVRGAEDVAFSNGFRLILCNTDNDHSKEASST